MNKEFEYRGHRFNIQVKLNTKAERRLNGETWHTVVINCMNIDNYYKKEEINDKSLVEYILSCEKLAKKYVDEKLGVKISEDYRLTDLGFK